MTAYATHLIRGYAEPSEGYDKKDVDGWHAAGHDEGWNRVCSLSWPGVAPAIHVLFISGPYDGRMGGRVYIMSNRRNGTLYIGVTNDLVRRVREHREGLGRSFVRKYGLTRLVHCERHEDIRIAIQRETSLKRWPRAWKVRLFAKQNPEWQDLYPTLFGCRGKDVDGRAEPGGYCTAIGAKGNRTPPLCK